MFVNNNMHLVFHQAPNYLGVRLDRMLNVEQHVEEVTSKVTYRASLVRRLAGTTWRKRLGSPHKPWYSLQLNTVPTSGAEAHMLGRLTSQPTALYEPYMVVSIRPLCLSLMCSPLPPLLTFADHIPGRGRSS